MDKVTFHNQEFTCPLCGHLNKFHTLKVDRGLNHRFTRCDVEEGGCDEKIVIETIVTTSINITPLIMVQKDEDQLTKTKNV